MDMDSLGAAAWVLLLQEDLHGQAGMRLGSTDRLYF
jgi:hypothetical protein